MNTKPLDGGPTIVQCGSGSCNLSKNTACVGITSSLQPTCDCIDSGASCPSMTAAFNCGGSADCTKGEVCCGQVDQSSITASTSCKATCPTTTMNNGQQGQSQVCSSNADCQSGVECIPQSCGFMGLAKLNLCGMQTAAPFSCTRQ